MLEHLQYSKERKGKSNKQQRKVYKTSTDKTKSFTFGSFSNLKILSALSAQGDEFLHQRLTREEHISIRKAKERKL
jgi:hypothetical protein